MANHEDLLRDLEEQERRDDARYRPFNLAGRELRKIKPVAKPTADKRTPLERFEQDFAPAMERRRRLEAGLPATNNPFVNVWLKMTGQNKLPVVQLVEPDEQFQVVGPTVDEIRKQIAENPYAFKHLAKARQKSQATNATRKTAEDLILQSKLRGPIKDDEEDET